MAENTPYRGSREGDGDGEYCVVEEGCWKEREEGDSREGGCHYC